MKKAFIIIPVIILAALLAVVAFYSVPFVKANSLIVISFAFTKGKWRVSAVTASD